MHPREGGKPGDAPGTFEVDEEAPTTVIQAFGYKRGSYVEKTIEDVEELRGFLSEWPVTWVNVNGLGDGKTLRALGKLFRIHPLVLEDVVHVHQRPKVEHYDAHDFIVARMADMTTFLDIEQVSIILGDNYVITFQERIGDCLDPLRRRIREGIGRVRRSKADYLAYAVLDGVVDFFFPVLEDYADRLERIEDEVLMRPSKGLLKEVLTIRHDLLALGRAVRPLREVLSTLHTNPGGRFAEETQLYLRDCYDHTLQILDVVDNYTQLSASVMDMYLSSSSHRMNEAMHLLTVIGAIFMPLTFITGLYGMNFDREVSWMNMPELGWKYGYPIALGVMLLTSLGLLGYFWRKKWLSPP